MKQVLYGEEEIELIKYLIENTPLEIWYNFTSYSFVYSDFYIEISMMDAAPATQNEFDEILFGQIERINRLHIASEHDELICEKKAITGAFIMRTLLYFDTFHTYSKMERLKNKFRYKLKSALTGKSDPVAKIISNTTGSGAEYTCNPTSEQAKDAIPEYSNLVDAGVLLEIEGKYLKAYVENNGFGFQVWDKKYLHDASDLDEVPAYFETIKVE